MISAVFSCDEPKSVAEKTAFLRSNRIAVWDVIASCDIVGSSDSSIRNGVPNDLSHILTSAKIQAIFVNGKTAYGYYNRYLRNQISREAICLPSTSPANAAWTLPRLIEAWRIVRL